MQEAIGDPTDQCYRASEALYHLGGGKEAGLTPMVARFEGGTHWWLRDANGNVLDPTAAQFDFDFPYETGRGCGFLTRQPSKKAQAVIRMVEPK